MTVANRLGEEGAYVDQGKATEVLRELGPTGGFGCSGRGGGAQDPPVRTPRGCGTSLSQARRSARRSARMSPVCGTSCGLSRNRMQAI